MRNIAKTCAILFLSLSSVLPSVAVAAPPVNGLGSLAKKHSARPFLQTKGFAMAPMGFVRLCMEQPRECEAPAVYQKVVNADANTLETLKRVNSLVNRQITPVNDDMRNDVLGDRWTASATAGDCEDYALAKRRMLIAEGISPAALRIAVGYTRRGVGHATLIVRTKRGDVVLDNRFDTLRLWNRTDVRWVSIQSSDDPRIWERL